VLRSVTDDGFYIGYSANLRRRFTQHAEGGAFATSYRRPWKLIYYEAYTEQQMRSDVNDTSKAAAVGVFSRSNLLIT
jgi:predicted GIY-YIG superfamily endonuclease